MIDERAWTGESITGSAYIIDVYVSITFYVGNVPTTCKHMIFPIFLRVVLKIGHGNHGHSYLDNWLGLFLEISGEVGEI